MEQLVKAKKVYFVGIKGVAMTSLALYLKEKGIKVVGSDNIEIFPTDTLLQKAKIKTLVGFASTHIQNEKPEAVIYTGAHGGLDNEEVQYAVAVGIPVYPHGKALGIFMALSRQIAVAGSHGKTTTAAMIATILEKAKKSPSWAIGCGEIRGLGNSGKHGKGNIFVAEADEYVTDPKHDQTPRFLWQKPEILVVTNIDFDHPDVYASLEQVQQAFVSLQKQQTGIRLTIINSDDKNSKKLMGGEQVISVGFSPVANFQITHVGTGSERSFFTLAQYGVTVGEFALKIPGRHNILNAVMAAVCCNNLGVGWEYIRAGLLQFGGSARRFEYIGIKDRVPVYDDYAHHPAEISATLKGAREWFPKKRIVAVFQPHTYSRTKALETEFAHAFDAADMVLLTEIYASAREKDSVQISGKSLFEKTKATHKNVFFTKTKKDVFRTLTDIHDAKDVIIFMGAGDIYGWSTEFLSV